MIKPAKKYLLILNLICLCLASNAYAIDAGAYCDAIYRIEGGANTRHPYGILAKYKHTTPRQACINTVNHAARDWNGHGSFNRFLAGCYAPVGATNDPSNLNSNWLHNLEAVLS